MTKSMATLITDKESLDWTEVCPNCAEDVRPYARLNGLDRWSIVRACHCQYISYEIRWPFAEENSFAEVRPGEFKQHDILLHGGNK
jgi:hypothetical protein